MQIQKAEMERALKKPGDINAWEAVMRSWAAYARFTTESLAIGVTEARRAVSLAPDYAVARATLAMALALQFNQTGFRDRALIDEAEQLADAALSLNPNHATVLCQVVNVLINAARPNEALPLAERAVALNPSSIDARHVLACSLTHHRRFEEALEQLAEGDRVAPRSFQTVFSLGHRSWALYGLGRLEEALACVNEYARLDPSFAYPPLTRVVCLQALGRTAEAQEAVRKARKVAPSEDLDFWLRLITYSYFAEVDKQSVAQHFTDAWNATPE